MSVKIQAARYLVYYAAVNSIEGKYPRVGDVLAAKYNVKKIGRGVGYAAVEIGWSRYGRTIPPERCMRDVMAVFVGGGTSQILKNVVASVVLNETGSSRKEMKCYKSFKFIFTD
jgi:alkylation response protein AidB-like acyl-CoA dehydrogenase